MRVSVYAYRDVKVGFLSPFVDQNDDTAIRGFSFAVNKPDGIMGFSASDFDLFRIGIFDSDSGCIEPCNPVEFVASGSSLVGAK